MSEGKKTDIQQLIANAKQEAFEEAAKACRNYLADCLDDRDIRKRWPHIHATNELYAKLILDLIPKPAPQTQTRG